MDKESLLHCLQLVEENLKIFDNNNNVDGAAKSDDVNMGVYFVDQKASLLLIKSSILQNLGKDRYAFCQSPDSDTLRASAQFWLIWVVFIDLTNLLMHWPIFLKTRTRSLKIPLSLHMRILLYINNSRKLLFRPMT